MLKKKLEQDENLEPKEEIDEFDQEFD